MKILLCDDQTITREGLKMILELEKGLDIVGVAKNGQQAVDMVYTLHPDLVLMDLKMPILNGVEATRKIISDFPKIKVLVLTTYDDEEWLFDAVRAGASGYLLKDSPREDLVRAIRETVKGKSFVDPSVAGKLLNGLSRGQMGSYAVLPGSLSDREKEILGLLADGFSNARIAREVFLSEGTVRNYVSTLFAKLGVGDRTQAAILARKMGLGH